MGYSNKRQKRDQYSAFINAFKKTLRDSNRKPNKIWVDQVSEFYNKYLRDFLKINDIEMYSTCNEGKSVVAERFIRTLKNTIFKHVTAIQQNIYFDVWDDIVDKYTNTVHRTIRIKPIEATDGSYAEYNEIPNKKDPKFKVHDNVRISRYQKHFC